jgi:hypothetical protein
MPAVVLVRVRGLARVQVVVIRNVHDGRPAHSLGQCLVTPPQRQRDLQKQLDGGKFLPHGPQRRVRGERITAEAVLLSGTANRFF